MNYKASHSFQLTFLHDDSDIWWRDSPEMQQCAISATALKPGKIVADSIHLDCSHPLLIGKALGLDTQYILSFSLIWDPPAFLYGGNKYEIYVGDRDRNIEEGISNPFSFEVVSPSW